MTGRGLDQSSVNRVPLDTMATKSEEQKKQGWFQRKKIAATEVMYRMKTALTSEDGTAETEDDTDKVSGFAYVLYHKFGTRSV